MTVIKTYLGDAVYADYEFGMVVLTTENGTKYPTNRICLEPEVYDALVKYVAWLHTSGTPDYSARQTEGDQL